MIVKSFGPCSTAGCLYPSIYTCVGVLYCSHCVTCVVLEDFRTFRAGSQTIAADAYDPSDDFRLLGEIMYRLVQSGDEWCDSPLIDKIRTGLGHTVPDLFEAWTQCTTKSNASQPITAEDLRDAVKSMRERSSVATWRIDRTADPAQVAALKEKYPPNKET